MKRALVLSGGGGRGAYQIGVWKALRELNIDFDIVTGTSVGALNGALITQGSYELAEKFWQNIDYDFVFNDEFFKNKDLTRKKIKLVRKYLRSTVLEKGLEVKSLENNIETYLDTDKIFNSKIDFGVVTYDLSSRKPYMVTKTEMNKNNIKDYIIASATIYPVFKKRKITNKYYIDGGFYDNLPINLAIDMGATEVIAVYIGVFGLRKKVKSTHIPITYIKPKSKLGSTLVFNDIKSKRGMQLGYNDTMKVFKKLDGNVYTFEKGNIDKLYGSIKQTVNKYAKLLGLEKDMEIKDFLFNIDFLGKLFDIDEVNIYKIDEFNKIILDKINNLKNCIDSKGIRNSKLYIFKHQKYKFIKIYNMIVTKELQINKFMTKILSFLFPDIVNSIIYVLSIKL